MIPRRNTFGNSSPDTLLKMNSPAVRSELVEALKLDLVGPDNDHAFAHELLPDAPLRWYLSGFLVP
jgi:hypothetical protein